VKIAIDVGLMGEEKVGAGTYLFNLLNNLAEIDKVTQYTGYGFFFRSFNSKLNSMSFPSQSNFNLNIKRFPAGFVNLLFNYFNCNLESFIGKVDIVHCLGSFVPKVRCARLVVTVFDLSSVLFQTFHTTFVTREAYLQAKLVTKRANKIITISHNSKRDIIRLLCVPEDKVVVIPLAAGESYKRVTEFKSIERFKDRYNLDKYILYVGTLEPRKNIINLLKAYSRLIKKVPELNDHLVIVGKKGWLYTGIFEEVKNLRIEDKVIFTGYVPNEDLVLFYNCADLFVYPSFYEGFGIPVLEAMSCGTPVITSNISSLPEVAGDAAILVDPKSVEEIANAMYKVLVDVNLREEMIEKGLKQAAQFSWKKTAQETLAVYNALDERCE